MAVIVKKAAICDICGREMEFSKNPWLYGWFGHRIGLWKRERLVKKKREFDICEDCYEKMIKFCTTNGEKERAT